MIRFNRDRSLTPESFQLLMRWLDSDSEVAARKYEAIQRRLIKFFECHGAHRPEEDADATIDRVARRLLEGEQVHHPDPVVYFMGVARNVLKEDWRGSRTAASLNELPVQRHPVTDPDQQDESVKLEHL